MQFGFGEHRRRVLVVGNLGCHGHAHLDESPDEIRMTLDSYRNLLSGRVAGRDVWKKLNAANRVGVTRGTLEERRNPLAIL